MFPMLVESHQPPKIDHTNFYIDTLAYWRFVEIPDKPPRQVKGKPDFESRSGSQYWYDRNGVYRYSDHWGEVASCTWHLTNFTIKVKVQSGQPKIPRKQDGTLGMTGTWTTPWLIAYCPWDGFEFKGNYTPSSILKDEIDRILDEIGYTTILKNGREITVSKRGTPQQWAKLDVLYKKRAKALEYEKGRMDKT